MDEETITQTSERDSLDLTVSTKEEVISVSRTEAQNFIQPLLSEDLYKKYFGPIRGTFWPTFNRIFCCRSISDLEAHQEHRREGLYEDYETFMHECKKVSNQEEKRQLQEKWEDHFRNWNDEDEEVFGKTGSRQHVQALLLIFLFYLQQVALIIIEGVNYPERWKDTLIWLRKVFLPDIRLDLSKADSTAIYAAFYLFIVVIHLLVYITDKTKETFYYSESSQTLTYYRVNIGRFIYYYLRDVIIPTGRKLGEEIEEIVLSFFKRSTKIFAILSFNLITPLASVILSLILNEERFALKITFSSTGVFILFSLLYYYWKIGQEKSEYYVLFGAQETKDVYRDNFQAYKKGFKWLVIVFFIEKILLTIVNKFFISEDDLTGGWISLAILSLIFSFLYYFVPYETQELNQIDILTRFSNIILLSIGIILTEEDSFSEKFATIILFFFTGITLIYWIFAFRKTIFSPQDCFEYFPLFVFFRFLYGGVQRFIARRRWKNVKTFDEAKNLLANRKKSGITKYEWSVFFADQKILFLCLDNDSQNISENYLDPSEDLDLIFSSIHTSEYFDRILAGEICSSLKIVSLELNSSGLTEYAFSYILESNLFNRLLWLTILEVHDCKLSPISNKNLFLSLLNGGFRLQSLRLGDIFCSSDHFDILGDYLSKTLELQNFHLENSNNFEPDSYKIILQSLNTEKLKYLKFHINRFGDCNISLLTDILKEANNLEYFDFEYENISKDSVIYLYAVFSSLKQTNRLNIRVLIYGRLTLFVLNEGLNTMSTNKNILITNVDLEMNKVIPGLLISDFFDKEVWFVFSENEIYDFSKTAYIAVREGINCVVSFALSLLNLEEKKQLKKNIGSQRDYRKKVSMKELIHKYGKNRKKETLESMSEIFGAQVYFREELDEQEEEGEEEYLPPNIDYTTLVSNSEFGSTHSS
eukprot:snap_masked-scaffold_30-processed-gene-0.19-mRNA-1 protein AED:1.00 eAED:1.00 QI:0/0/0/0/1/1/3/0/929